MRKEQVQQSLAYRSDAGRRWLISLFVGLLPLLVATQPVIVNLPDQYFICEGGNVVLTPQVFGGVPPYTYVWTPVEGLSCTDCAAPTATPTQTTTYVLTVRDNANGEGMDWATVTVAPEPTATISPAQSTVCANTPLVLVAITNGTVGCSIVWESSSTGIDGWAPIAGANGSVYYPPTGEAGVAYYRVRYSCTGSNCGEVYSEPAPVTVTSEPAAEVHITPSELATCQGGSITLEANISGNPGNCTVQWQRASPWANIPGATGMTYTPPTSQIGTNFYRAVLTCPDNTCGSTIISNQVPVAVLRDPELSISPSSRTVCVGGQASLTATTNGSNIPCDFSWLSADTPDGPWTVVPGATTATFMPPTTQEGTVYYTVVPACYIGGCALPASNVVPVTVASHVEPNIVMVPQPALCNGQQTFIVFTVTGAGDVHFINNVEGTMGGQSASGVPMPIGPLQPGLRCFLINGDNGCAATEVCATVDPAPQPIVVTSTVNAASCMSSNDGSITVTTTGGVPPYTHEWSTGETSSTGISGLGAGPYGLTVTDANGCFQVLSFTVGALLTVNAGPDQILDCNTTEVSLQGTASLAGGNITYAWYNPEGVVISTETEVVVNEGGLYRFRATHTALGGCFSEDEVLVTDVEDLIEDEISTTLTACNTWLLSAIPPAYSGPVVFEWTLPDGSISTALQITATVTGVYQLRTSLPGTGCQTTIAHFVDADDQCATISGHLADDLNENCLVETGETPLSNWMVRATGAAGDFYALSDAAGGYHFSLPLGSYTLRAIPLSASWVLCQSTYNINLSTVGQAELLDIPAQHVVLCPELEVQLSAPLLRRCFPSTYTVRVCNTGTETAAAPLVALVLDDLITYQAAQYTPDSIQGQTIYWTLPDLAPGQCRQFWVQVGVSCDAVLGQEHCSTVMATPDLLCTPTSPAWSGASLEVSGECTGDETVFRVRNAGSGDLLSPVEYIVIEDVVMLMEPATLDALNSGAEEAFSFPANGSTYIFSIEQAANHPFGNTVTVAVEGCGTNDQGSFSTGFVNQLPLQTTTPASDVLCMANIGAYDPNDKQAIPTGYGPEHAIRAGDPLQYKIRFQNTGTDTAFTVIVRDTLSTWLDLSKLRPGPASHPYRLSIDGQRTLVFSFDNILLPDSTTNLEGSQGYVDFFIETLDTIPSGSRIENSAAIYFDFNEPVITNTVFHTIGRDFISGTTVIEPQGQSSDWHLFPNPASEAAWLVHEQALPGPKTASVYDLQGRAVLQVAFEGQQCRLPFRQVEPGWYVVQVRDAHGQTLDVVRLLVH